jgi:glyoxylase-like metal-dependent hydrolase (beta-lactamase superfamily II)
VTGGGAVHVGDVDVVSLLDAEGSFTTVEGAFPDVPADHWAPWRELWPELFDGDDWVLPYRSFLVRAGDATILVDTGVGPPGDGWFLPERQGRLLGELERQGITPGEVDVVFVTHVHVDHVGWNPAFASSRFVVHRDAWAAAQERADREHIAKAVLPLAERVETVTGDAELAPGVVAFEAPGHSPGHMCIRIGEELVLLGDAAPHPVLLTQAGWRFSSDEDPELAEQTRERLLETYGDRILAASHYPGSGFGRLVDGVWVPLTTA